MKKLFLALATLMAIGSLTGCGTTQTAPTAQNSDRYEAWVDKEKVAAIESAARSHSVKVYWMQYPTKKDTTIK